MKKNIKKKAAEKILKRYCCIPDLIMDMSSNKKIALKILGSIWDRRRSERNEKETKKKKVSN